MIQELKAFLCTCNLCGTTSILKDVIEGTIPDNWIQRVDKAIDDGYQGKILITLSGLQKVFHYCEKCKDKIEIKEVFE